MIYLDNAATTQMAPEVREAMEPFLTEQFGNPSSLHSMGQKAAEAVANARKQVATLFGCEPRQIIFTSGGSESNTLAILGLKEYLLSQGKTQIITSATEHESVLKAVESMTKFEFDTQILPFAHPDLRHTRFQLTSIISEKTGLVSFMNENNETGEFYRPDIFWKLSKRDKSFLTHMDMTQTTCPTNYAFLAKHIDFLSLSSHKIHGPKGVGVLYAKNPDLLSPQIHGGSGQEFGLRGGTTNVAGVVGLGVAAQLLWALIEEEYSTVESLCSLQEAFISTLKKEYPHFERDIHINGSGTKIINLQIDGIRGDSLVLAMSSRGVCISAGSACSSHYDKPSHVLLALGLSEEQAKNSVRISFSRYNTTEEAVKSAKIMAECITLLKGCDFSIDKDE